MTSTPTIHIYTYQPTYQQIKLSEPNAQAVGAAVTQPQYPTLPLIGAAVATLALTHDTTQLD